MTEQFDNGYAVIIGVNESMIPNLALPTVAADVRAVHDVLIHPERCAYRADNVRLLMGADSTRANIMAALDWLREKTAADPNATAVLYYSGHGAVDGGNYYLIPYDVDYGTIYSDAIPAEEFNGRVSATHARRLLVVLDCCHAGGVASKDAGLEALGDLDGDEDLPITAAPFPIDLTAADLPEYDDEAAGKGLTGGLETIGDLLEGEGRAVLNSSTGAQKSYLRQDRAMSLFTYHFIEALTGHAPHHDDDTTVLVTDVMSWVTREVKKSAAREGRNQTPVMRTSGVFPVAQLLGGKGLAKGMGEVAPDPLESLPPVEGGAVTFNQQEQSVGTQMNITGDATIGQIGDVIHGDKVAGDKIAGDKITVGNITGSSGVAIGQGASVMVTTVTTGGATGGDSPLPRLRALAVQHSPEMASKAGALIAEIGRGAAADDTTVAGLIDDLARGIPGAGGLLREVMNSSEAAAAANGPVTKFVLSRLN